MAGRKPQFDATYFPFYAKDGRTLFMLQSKFGLEGIGFFTNLLRLLCLTPHHYLDLSNQADAPYTWAKIGIQDDEKAEKIMGVMVLTGKIDALLWEKCRVIYSQDFVDSLSELYAKRKESALSLAQIRGIYGIDSPEMPISAPEIPGNTNFRGQQYAKKRKEKEREEFAAPVETTVVEKPVDKMPNFDPDIPTLKTPDGVKFAPEELAELVAHAGPDAQAHLDKFARKIAMHRYGYKNHWAALKDFWANAGGAKAWLSPRDSPQSVTPSFVPDISQSATILQRLERYRQEAASTEDIERFETFVVGFRS